MIVPDANLLLYAYDAKSPHHLVARKWWESCLSGNEPVGLTFPVIFAFVRVSTLANVFEQPLSLTKATKQVELWVDRQVTRVLSPAADHCQQVLNLLREAASAGGNLVTDAQVAAVAIAHGATVHTADRDFMRFQKLNCYYPLDQSARK